MGAEIIRIAMICAAEARTYRRESIRRPSPLLPSCASLYWWCSDRRCDNGGWQWYVIKAWRRIIEEKKERERINKADMTFDNSDYRHLQSFFISSFKSLSFSPPFPSLSAHLFNSCLLLITQNLNTQFSLSLSVSILRSYTHLCDKRKNKWYDAVFYSTCHSL